MKKLNMADLRNQWEPLSTPELEAMLQAELARNTPDEEKVILLIHILENREKNMSLQLSAREEEAWQKYKQKVMKRQRKRKLPPRLLSVAASLVLIVAVLFSVAQPAKAESFWQMLQRITHSVMEYFSPSESITELNYTFTTENPGLQQVYVAVVELGVTEPVVPMWLPENVELIELDIVDTPMATDLCATFLGNGNEIVYKLNVFNGEPAHQYYKDDTHYEKYEQNGTVYYIAQNNGWWTAVWTKENIECHLTMPCQEETLRRILRSIHVNGG